MRLGFGRAAALALVAMLAVPHAGCRKKPQVSLEVDVPAALSDNAKWVEIGVFGGTSCGGVASLLPGGIPPEGTAARLAFERGKSTPPLGDLPKGRYAFAAVAKDANCGVVAIGCSDVDVSVETSVAINLKATDAGAGPCSPGARCLQARCVPGIDNGDPALGADCSLDLVGSGPLGDPLVANGELVSSPAIAAVANGFLVAYREYDPFGGQARAVYIFVDNGGGATPGPATTLPERCQSGEESDAMAMAFSRDNNAGLSVVSRAACSPKPAGIDLLQIDGLGNVSQSGFEGKGEPRRLLSNAHALAFDPKGGDYILAFTQGKDAEVVFASGNRLEQRGAILFGGGGTRTGAWVAASDRVRAFLAVGTGIDAPPPVDAGLGDGGNEAGPPFDSGTGGSTVRLQVLNASDDPSALATAPLLDTFPGTWGAVAVTGARIVVASDGAGAGKQVAYRVYEGSGPPKAVDGLIVEGAGRVAYTDIALNQDRMFFAVEKASPPTGSSIALFAYTQATTTPVFKRRVLFPKDPRIPALGGVRDGQLAVAASDTRVAVVWTSGKNLTDKDAVGGYAVFACSTP